MKIFTHNDQLSYASIALALFDNSPTNKELLVSLLAVGEQVKAHANEDNAVIYDLTEYLYERLRLLNKEDGAYDETELRLSLERAIEGTTGIN